MFDPQGAYPGCQYGPNGMMRQGYPCWSYGPQGAQGARDFRPGFEQRKVYLRGALNLTDAQNQLLKLISAPLMPIIR